MVDNNPKERGGFFGGIVDGFQGLFSGYSATESFTKALLSMGSAYQAAASISGFVSWIAEALGFQGFADKAHNFGLRMAQKAGNLDSNTQTTGKGDANGQNADLESQGVAYNLGGPTGGAVAGAVIGRTGAVALDTAGRGINFLKGAPTAPTGILGKVLGRTKFGKALTLLGAGVGGFGTSSANAAEIPRTERGVLGNAYQIAGGATHGALSIGGNVVGFAGDMARNTLNGNLLKDTFRGAWNVAAWATGNDEKMVSLKTSFDLSEKIQSGLDKGAKFVGVDLENGPASTASNITYGAGVVAGTALTFLPSGGTSAAFGAAAMGSKVANVA